MIKCMYGRMLGLFLLAGALGPGVADAAVPVSAQSPAKPSASERARQCAELTKACPKIAFIRRAEYGLNGTNATMFARRTGKGSAIQIYDPATPDIPARTIFETKEGFIWDIRPSYDNTKLLMSYKETHDQPFHVWEIGIDGSGLKQLTSGNYHDFNPVYYPDGRIVFCSSRVESYSLCQDFLASALYIMDGGGGNLRRIDFTTLCTSAPAILPDGSILCSRWEYQDKNIFQWQGLWTINPDGRQLKLYFVNTFTVPNSRYGGKPVPGTNQVLITMAAHHRPPVADIAVVDRSHGLEALEGLRKVTFETPYAVTRGRDWQDRNWGPGDRYFPWAVTDPWPLRDGLFLASFGQAPAGGRPGRFAICLARYDGARREIYGREGESFFSPVTLDQKPLPRVIAGEVPTQAGEGIFFVQDVYEGLLQQGVARGQVKALRVIRPVPKKWNTEGPRFHDHYPLVGYGSYYVKENLGEAPVDANGAAYFRAPANCELYFIALDQDGKEVQRMGSVTQITTGEYVACIGCHDDRMKTAQAGLRPSPRLQQPPDQLRPPPGGAGPFDYVKQVQPVWDQYCVSCHSGRNPKGGVDLSGGRTRFFNLSYECLIRRRMVEYYYINQGPTGVFPALQSGSQISKLTRLIEGRHHEVVVNDESRRRVYAWIDANVPYYGTWDMSRPHTIGGRDAWSFCRDNRRVAPAPEPWFREFLGVYAKNCAACHPQEPFAKCAVLAGPGVPVLELLNAFRADHAANSQINLSTPEFSRVLNVHLSREAGGVGQVGKGPGRATFMMKDTADPVYQQLLQAIQAGRAALEARPRMDMPGGVAVPQERDFGKVF